MSDYFQIELKTNDGEVVTRRKLNVSLLLAQTRHETYPGPMEQRKARITADHERTASQAYLFVCLFVDEGGQEVRHFCSLRWGAQQAPSHIWRQMPRCTASRQAKLSLSEPSSALPVRREH